MSEEKSSKQDPESSKKQLGQEVRYVPVEYVDSPHSVEDEINLLDLIKTIWEGRKTIYMAIAIFGGLGLFFYIFGPDEYESDAILIQENQQGMSQQLQLLQSLSGFGGGNTDLNGEVIPATMYPDIVESSEFQLRVIQKEVEFEEFELNSNLIDFFELHYTPPFTELLGEFIYDYTIGLPFTIMRGVRWVLRGGEPPMAELPVVTDEDDNYLVLTAPQRRTISEMSSRNSIEMSGGLITVTTRLPDPRAAAEINRHVIELIQEYVIEYRIEKARQNLEFIEEQTMVAKQRYDEAQQGLASYMDQNVNISTASAQTRLEELQNVRNIRYNVYNSLAQQVEQARIKLQEETPVFNILQRSSIPSSTVGASKLLLILSLFLGAFFGIVWVFGRNILIVVKDHLND